MKKLQRLPLAVLISIGLYGIPTESFAACTASDNTITIDNNACEISATSPATIDTSKTVTVNSSTPIGTQAQIRIDTDLNGADNALILGDKLGLRYSVQVGQTKGITVQSDGTAILYNGTELENNGRGIDVKNGSTVKGTDYAIHAPNLQKEEYENYSR